MYDVGRQAEKAAAEGLQREHRLPVKSTREAHSRKMSRFRTERGQGLRVRRRDRNKQRPGEQVCRRRPLASDSTTAPVTSAPTGHWRHRRKLAKVNGATQNRPGQSAQFTTPIHTGCPSTNRVHDRRTTGCLIKRRRQCADRPYIIQPTTARKMTTFGTI